uniref:Uncharacterized protein n=1 Tax=Alexandrium catenella TaxID=2925 RepID=A0A6T9HWH4_ALECA
MTDTNAWWLSAALAGHAGGFCLAAVFLCWRASFREKARRSSARSPSHGQRPSVAAEGKHTSRLVELVGAEVASEAPRPHGQVPDRGLAARMRSKRRPSVVPGSDLRLPRDVRSERLDMDHVRLSFPDFLWCLLFVAPGTALLAVGGLLRKKFREVLHSAGAVRPRPHDPAAVTGRLLLETYRSIHYTGTRHSEAGGGPVASFAWHRVPVIDGEGRVRVASSLAFEVDLRTKSVTKAELEGEPLTAKEALVMAWWLTISHDHVRIHSLANWGVNLEYSDDGLLKRMGMVTVFYNWLGYNVFPLICKLTHAVRFMRADFSGISQCFDESQKVQIPPHLWMHELAKHSALVDFTLKVRNRFMNCFAEHHREFPAIDGEALFVGTIVHSLDHVMAELIMEDLLWLDVDGVSHQFRGMADIGRLVRSGFTQDLPLLMFDARCRAAAPDTLFGKVYAHAAGIDAFLADHMDMLIVK